MRCVSVRWALIGIAEVIVGIAEVIAAECLCRVTLPRRVSPEQIWARILDRYGRQHSKAGYPRIKNQIDAHLVAPESHA